MAASANAGGREREHDHEHERDAQAAFCAAGARTLWSLRETRPRIVCARARAAMASASTASAMMALAAKASTTMPSAAVRRTRLRARGGKGVVMQQAGAESAEGDVRGAGREKRACTYCGDEKEVACPVCNGEGIMGRTITCRYCKGAKQLPCPVCAVDDELDEARDGGGADGPSYSWTYRE